MLPAIFNQLTAVFMEQQIIHDLKTWKPYFMAVLYRWKKFEVRANDRNFKVGDLLRLKEWDQMTGNYTGREVVKEVEYILEGGNFGIQAGFVVMGITDLKPDSDFPDQHGTILIPQ